MRAYFSVMTALLITVLSVLLAEPVFAGGGAASIHNHTQKAITH